MAGTIKGGKAAAATNKRKYGEDFYRQIGQKGGRLGRTGGFYANRELARKAGAIGGRISRWKTTEPTCTKQLKSAPESAERSVNHEN